MGALVGIIRGRSTRALSTGLFHSSKLSFVSLQNIDMDFAQPRSQAPPSFPSLPVRTGRAWERG